MEKINLKSLIVEQKERFLAKEGLLPREVLVTLGELIEQREIVFLSGVRRCGKSSLMRLCCDELGARKGVSRSDILYLNFEDERLLDFSAKDFEKVLEVFDELRGRPGRAWFFLDEIQNIPGWERVVRRMHDEGYHIFLTGSNSHLLSIEFGTHLTGRYIQIELFPFGFDEICRFQKVLPDRSGLINTQAEAGILRLFTSYLETGGFPEYQSDPDPDILRRTFDDIIFRDVITRYGIREIKAFRELARYLFTNMTREASLNSLASAIGIKSGMSVKTWIGYLEDSYLLGSLCQYEYSM